jgi:hemerythrin superfamily protein
MLKDAPAHVKGILLKYFVQDHRRLESILKQATQSIENIDLKVYSEFRAGLLRHIGIEEKILLPMIKSLQGGAPYSSAGVLRLEHGALAALLTPLPNRQIVEALQAILDHHNSSEECEHCLYAVCEKLFEDRLDRTMDEIAHYPAVPAAPYADLNRAREPIRRALERAGFDFDRFEVPTSSDKSPSK